jgi:hypothetical protein
VITVRNLPTKVPHNALASVVYQFDLRKGDTLELVVTVADAGINAREFAAYLRLMDRVYGRVLRGDLRSYALTSHGQLEIAKISKGSLDISIVDVFSQFHDAIPLLMLWLFLRYVPAGLKAISEVTKNLADSFKAIEEGRLTRLNRKKLKEDLQGEERLRVLNTAQINELVALLASLEIEEHRTLPAAVRFSEKYVKDVTIMTKKRGEGQ